jgi:DTW domain-containing protein YfiP
MTRVVLIQHLLERRQKSNTGRHAAAVLPDVSLRTFGEKESPLKVDDLEDAWLLWPSATPLGEGEPLPSTIVVIDASWSQARHMVQRVPALRGLRRWSLPAPASRRSLRTAPPGGMSTIEALAEALAVLEGEASAQPLRDAHERLLQQQLHDRGYVGG